ncbi:hypothetical protein GGI35DRAFT_430610 [Trichoderma velutinum]
MRLCACSIWQPLWLSAVKLFHRTILTPLPQYRNDDNQKSTDMMIIYCAGHASVVEALIVTEITCVLPSAKGEPNLPGINTLKQMNT